MYKNEKLWTKECRTAQSNEWSVNCVMPKCKTITLDICGIIFIPPSKEAKKLVDCILNNTIQAFQVAIELQLVSATDHVISRRTTVKNCGYKLRPRAAIKRKYSAWYLTDEHKFCCFLCSK